MGYKTFNEGIPSESGDKSSSKIQLFIAVFGVYLTTFFVVLFNKSVLMSLSLPFRMIAMIVTQWLLFLVPGILMLRHGEKLKELGFKKEKLPKQIVIGIIPALAISLVFTISPILLGFKEMISDINYRYIWQFIYEFIRSIVGVGLSEELVFRGYIFYKILDIHKSRKAAIILSSLLFGFFHIFNGNIMQVIMTTLLGILFCLFREKIKDFSLLSLIICHGVYDALIPVWIFLL